MGSDKVVSSDKLVKEIESRIERIRERLGVTTATNTEDDKEELAPDQKKKKLSLKRKRPPLNTDPFKHL